MKLSEIKDVETYYDYCSQIKLPISPIKGKLYFDCRKCDLLFICFENGEVDGIKRDLREILKIISRKNKLKKLLR